MSTINPNNGFIRLGFRLILAFYSPNVIGAKTIKHNEIESGSTDLGSGGFLKEFGNGYYLSGLSFHSPTL